MTPEAPPVASQVGFQRAASDVAMNFACTEIKAFVPALDFAVSRQFDQALGFEIAWSSDDLAYVRFGDTSFLLQSFAEPAFAKNYQMHPLDPDVDAWHAPERHCQQPDGRGLLRYGASTLTVQTGSKNTPALNLYARAGSVEVRRWLVGREPLKLVKLSRPPQSGAQPPPTRPQPRSCASECTHPAAFGARNFKSRTL